MSDELTLHDKFAAISQREKVMVLSAGIVVIVLVLFTFLVEPTFKHNRFMATEISGLEIQINSLKQQKDVFAEALSEDPNAELNAVLTQLDKRQLELEQAFAAELQELVLPAQMPILIEQVFQQAKALELVEMSSLAPVNIFADNPEMEDVALYQHGVKLVFSGRYFDVRNFLAQLERLTSQVYWRSMSYHVSEYPNAEVVIEVYTLSTERAFIGVE